MEKNHGIPKNEPTSDTDPPANDSAEDSSSDDLDPKKGAAKSSRPAWAQDDPLPQKEAGDPNDAAPPSKVVVDPSFSRDMSDLEEEAENTRTYGNQQKDTGNNSKSRSKGLRITAWIFIGLIVLIALLVVLDFYNRHHYQLKCVDNLLELQKGRTFPWPFGHAPIGGPEFKPIRIRESTDCRDRSFNSLEEAELAFLDTLLAVASASLSDSKVAAFQETREILQQALLLTRTHESRRKETEKLLAEAAYLEGRSSLSRVENELRAALARFQEAQKLDPERYGDLDDWISHLEQTLETLFPPPGTPTAKSYGTGPLPMTSPGTEVMPPSSHPYLDSHTPGTSYPDSEPGLPAGPQQTAPQKRLSEPPYSPGADAGPSPSGKSGILL